MKVQTLSDAVAADLAYQTTERPTGIIFGFGVLIGIIVRIVIVYQVLFTDVADHLREYATFKTICYSQRFFLGIALEEAIVLAVFGFIPGFLVSIGLYVGLGAATGLPAALAKDSGRTVVEMLKSLGQTRDTTTVIVPHYNCILALADRMTTLEEGRVVEDIHQNQPAHQAVPSNEVETSQDRFLVEVF